MDGDTTDLIAHLGTRIGMIMEDVSDLALTLGGMDQSEMAAAIKKLDHAAAISSLTGALQALAI